MMKKDSFLLERKRGEYAIHQDEEDDHVNHEYQHKDENEIVEDDILPPPDHYHLTYIIFVILGSGILVPWITMLTAVDYFNYLYPNYNFEFNISISYMYPNCITLLFVVRYCKRLSISGRVVAGFALFALVFLIVPFVDNSVSQRVGFGITMLAGGVLGFADAMVQGTLYGFAGLFPPMYTQAVQTGTGAAGFLISFSRIITKAALPDTPEGLRTGSLIYFGFSSFFMAMCVLCYFYFLRLPMAQWGLARAKRQITEEDHQSEYDMKKDGAHELILKVFKQIWAPALSVGFNFFITLFLFPGLISIIPSTRGPTWSWFPVILISLFNFFDFVGKAIPKFCYHYVTEKWVHIITISRVVFFPLLFFCVKPRIFDHDFFPIIFVILFALSNGFIGSLVMMIGPTKVDTHEKEIAGTIMAFCLVLGLSLGATCGWAIPYMIE